MRHCSGGSGLFTRSRASVSRAVPHCAAAVSQGCLAPDKGSSQGQLQFGCDSTWKGRISQAFCCPCHTYLYALSRQVHRIWLGRAALRRLPRCATPGQTSGPRAPPRLGLCHTGHSPAKRAARTLIMCLDLDIQPMPSCFWKKLVFSVAAGTRRRMHPLAQNTTFLHLVPKQ